MKKLFSVSFNLLMIFFAINSYADFTGKGHVHTLAESTQTFLNPGCRTNDSCDLKRFTLTTLAHEVWFSDDPKNPTHANGVIMEYETDSVDAIEKYAIVQFVKGCVFSTTKNHGKIDKQINYAVSSFGESIPLCFPRWVIDSQDAIRHTTAILNSADSTCYAGMHQAHTKSARKNTTERKSRTFRWFT
jgi:hypothetical protein